MYEYNSSRVGYQNRPPLAHFAMDGEGFSKFVIQREGSGDEPYYNGRNDVTDPQVKKGRGRRGVAPEGVGQKKIKKFKILFFEDSCNYPVLFDF